MLIFRDTVKRHPPDFAIQAGLPESPGGFAFPFRPEL